MESERLISREECKARVEDAWRKMLNFAAQGSEALGMQCILRLEETTAATAATLDEPAKSLFLRDIDEERGAIFDEYSSNPAALKSRLGVGPRQYVTANQYSSVQSLADTVVNTAVRATVWESVRAMFRMFR